MKLILFIILLIPCFGLSQTAYLMQDAQVQVAEGNTYNVVTHVNIAPVEIIDGGEFTALISQMPAPYTGITTSVEYIDEKLTSVKVYPNPFTGLVHVNLDLESRENLRFQIINLNGMMIKSRYRGIQVGLIRINKLQAQFSQFVEHVQHSGKADRHRRREG